ncbi:hypothetical protein HHK36_030447 [Tetracentron sinense]|uniref:BHLH domain-containing protein n=1 Tax=Tetracentron sinense TaxID=13715 RepID=A0A834Y9L7_TETSI|nr:hypothetical protein HHK36_030447 [Tetracentron sinense]
MAQCNFSWQQEAMIVQSITDTNFQEQPTMLNRELEGSSQPDGLPNELQLNPLSAYTQKKNNFQAWVSPTTTADNLNLSWDLPVDQIHLSNSPMNFFGGSRQEFPTSSKKRPNQNFFDESNDSIMSENPMGPFNFSAESGFQEMVSLQQSLLTTDTDSHPTIMESSVNKRPWNCENSIKQDLGRSDLVSDCNDQIEDDADGHKVVGRIGREPQSKNLVAERKRRKKLSERLLALRALVPKITKMDRASILGDAIEFLKELQKQAKDLQDELEEPSDPEGAKNSGSNSSNNNFQSEMPNPNGISHGANPEHGKALNGSQTIHDKAQEMEVQVEVAIIGGNEFFLKVFCEHKPGGFVRLMEALNSLGLEVTNANVTTFRGLVLNVFRVEKRDSEMVQADYVKDSLLELTRNPTGSSSEPGSVRTSENGRTVNYHHLHPQAHHITSYHHHPN